MDWLSMNGVLITDEAEASYKYTSLWNDLIKFLEPGFDLRIAIFSAYGSPRSRVEDAATSSSVYFDPQRVSLKRSVETDFCILFSRDGFADVVVRCCKSYGQTQPFSPSDELVEYIWQITQGHAAAVVAVLTILAEASELRHFRETASVIPLADAMDFIQSDDFLRAALNTAKFSCGLVPMKALESSPNLIGFLQEAVSVDIIAGRPKPESPLDVCYTKGWLQAEMAED